MNGTEILKDIVLDQHRGDLHGIYSICSSHPWVIDASLDQAGRDGSVVLIESTSNQVNQFGGYTGMTPRDFRDLVLFQSRERGISDERVILGGDHLGPIPFQAEDADTAMTKASDMVRRFVEAGFVKIHLDTSIPLGGETSIEPARVAERCARLCRVCEETYSGMTRGGRRASPAPVYIIGTEVPVPGGSDEVEEGVQVTSGEDFEETVRVTRDAFVREKLENAWDRVVAVVVQPGVEFGDRSISEYNRKDASHLGQKLRDYPNLVFEAHSTDYQTARKMREMVEDGFAILKVGPGLTYAFREAVFMLCAIEDELCTIDSSIIRSNLLETVEDAMMHNPVYWQKYYDGSDMEQAYKRRYSFFDRIRYYWSEECVQASFKKLLHNIKNIGIPETLLSQFFPSQYRKIRDGELSSDPDDLLRDRVREVISDYAYAARMHGQ
jgi:D-tagatose-1,6-bisphosphate aldolase subunit GatZ/KbaZ